MTLKPFHDKSMSGWPPLPSVPPGRYRVEWQVLSTDGHVVSGRFAFTVQ